MVGLFCFTSIFPEKPYTESQVPDCELSFQRFFKNTPTNRSPFLLILKGCDNVTVEEKNSIIRLRKVGQGYSTIAATLGLSKETVKSFCRRNDLGGRRAQSADFQRGIICPNCGKKIQQSDHTKTKRFCSAECRQSWWNAHPECVGRKAVYNYVCAKCGRNFTAYGNSHRKYCSHACYVSARFKGGVSRDARAV